MSGCVNSNTFVCQLSEDNQEKIKQQVSKYLLNEGYGKDKIKEVISNVMDDRLWNIELIMDIKQFMN